MTTINAEPAEIAEKDLFLRGSVSSALNVVIRWHGDRKIAH
jgi:hypothetical protein